MHDPVVPRVRMRRAVAAVAGGLLVLSACGGGGGTKEEAATGTVEEQFGFEPEGILLRQTRVENLLRDCMKAQGFEYIPVDPATQQASLTGSSGLSERDFEKQFGYGITTLYEQRRRAGAGGTPNQAIRGSLGPADRSAYDRALLGENTDATFAEALDSGDFTRLGGCTKEATGTVFGGLAVLQSFQSRLDDLDERIVADQRMVKAIGKWSACMRSAGFSLQDPDDVDSVLRKKLDAIVGPAGEIAAAPDAEPTYDTAALAALQKEEVAMVGADITCEKKHIVPVEEKVRAEYETKFREENADLLSKVPKP